MPRKRMIKPEFWTDEKVIELPIPGRLLFIGLLNFADDEGIFRNSPKSIKCEVFPADTSPSPDDIKEYIDLMLNLKLIVKGEDLEGNELLRIKNWHDHQKINHPTPSKYIFKLDTIVDSVSPKVELSEDSVNPNGELSEDSLTISIDSISSLNSINSIDKSANKNLEKQNEDFSFAHIWKSYPKKKNKEQSEKAFNRLSKKEFVIFSKGLERHLKYWKDNDVDVQFIPLLSTFINKKRYNDELDAHISEKKAFKSDLDKEIYNRNDNIVKQSKRMRDYIDEANDNATNEVPNLLDDFKKGKSDAKPIGEIIGQMDTIPESNTSTDG